MADANWASVVGALRLDNSLTDVGPQAPSRTWTATNGGHSSAQAKTGGYSFASGFPGGAVNYFRSDTHADFAVSDYSAYSVQCWFYKTVGADPTNSHFMLKFVDGSDVLQLLTINRTLRLNSTAGGNTDSTANIFAYDSWVHLLWTIVGTTHKIYLDGTLALTATKSHSITGTGYLQVGELVAGPGHTVYFDDVVCWKGVEVQTGTFTPVAPFEVGLTSASASGFFTLTMGDTPFLQIALPATALSPTTTSGTPAAALSYRESGFLATTFGTPGVIHTVIAFNPVNFGSVEGRQYSRVRPPLGLVTRFGTPAANPIPRTVRSMNRLTRFGVPQMRRFDVTALGPRARFGRPTARHTATGEAASCNARGNLRTVIGTPVCVHYTP